MDSSSDSTTLSESLAPLRACLTCQNQRKINSLSIAKNCVENGINSTWVPVRRPGSKKQEASFSSLHSYCRWKPLLHSGVTRSFVPLLQHPPHLKAHQKCHLCWCSHPRNTAVKIRLRHRKRTNLNCIKPKVQGQCCYYAGIHSHL